MIEKFKAFTEVKEIGKVGEKKIYALGMGAMGLVVRLSEKKLVKIDLSKEDRYLMQLLKFAPEGSYEIDRELVKQLDPDA